MLSMAAFTSLKLLFVGKSSKFILICTFPLPSCLVSKTPKDESAWLQVITRSLFLDDCKVGLKLACSLCLAIWTRNVDLKGYTASQIKVIVYKTDVVENSLSFNSLF